MESDEAAARSGKLLHAGGVALSTPYSGVLAVGKPPKLRKAVALPTTQSGVLAAAELLHVRESCYTHDLS